MICPHCILLLFFSLFLAIFKPFYQYIQIPFKALFKRFKKL